MGGEPPFLGSGCCTGRRARPCPLRRCPSPGRHPRRRTASAGRTRCCLLRSSLIPRFSGSVSGPPLPSPCLFLFGPLGLSTCVTAARLHTDPSPSQKRRMPPRLIANLVTVRSAWQELYVSITALRGLKYLFPPQPTRGVHLGRFCLHPKL